jgi:tetratricopeptide (TPR) repeat protein
MEERLEKEDNCVSCHMPLKGSVDIPHVSVHDHYIRKPVDSEPAEPSVIKGLYAVNNTNPTRLSKLRAYLQQYERFDLQPVLLDSAESFLSVASLEQYISTLHYYFLRNDYDEMVSLSIDNDVYNADLSQMTFDNRFAWTSYRLAVAWKSQTGGESRVRSFYEQAVKSAPFILEFRNSFAAYLLTQGDLSAAIEQYETVYSLNHKNVEALNGLGYILMIQGDMVRSQEYLNKCLQLDPDHRLAMINKILWFGRIGQYKDAKDLLNSLSKTYPEDPRVAELSLYLSQL